MSFLLGADPELFLKLNGKTIGVYETGLPGDKETPFKTRNGAVQQDGMAAEFNVDPVPLEDFKAFNDNVVRTMGDLRDLVNAGDKKYSLSISPVADFTKEYLDAAPSSAKELGCNPDMNAYTLDFNPRPEGDTVLFRTGAGHLHFGWGADIPADNPEHIEICANFVKALDATVGLFMTIIDREPRRRVLYGKAGAFRPKSYGVEYRTPSNVWLKNQTYRELIHILANKAVKNATNNHGPDYLFPHYRIGHNDQLLANQENVQKVIDEGNHEVAYQWVNYMLRGTALWNSKKAEILRVVEKEATAVAA